MSEVLDAACEWWEALVPEDRLGREYRRTTLLNIAKLRPFWEGLRVGDIQRWGDPKGTLNRYVESRTSDAIRDGGPERDGAKAVSMARAVGELVTMRAEIYRFQADNGLAGKVSWKLPANTHAPVDWLERDHVARLLWAVRGRVWDPKTGTWEIEPETGRRVIRRWVPSRTRRRRWDASLRRWVGTRRRTARIENPRTWVARLILFLVYTGSTGRCASRVRWAPSAGGDASYVDLDELLEGRSGHLHRLGPDLASENMAGVPITLSRRLTAHMRRWRDADRLDGFAHPLHMTASDVRNTIEPDAPFEHPEETLRRVWAQAGLEGTSILPVLRDTAVVWVLRSGMRIVPGMRTQRGGKGHERPKPFKPGPAIMRSAALMIGKNYKDFVERFESVTPDFFKRQVKALRSPAKSVR